MRFDGSSKTAQFDEFVAKGTEICKYTWDYQVYFDGELFFDGLQIIDIQQNDVNITYDPTERNFTFQSFIRNKIYTVEVIGTLSDIDST